MMNFAVDTGHLNAAALALGAIGAIAGTVCLFTLRDHRRRLKESREELDILVRQCQTEYREGLGELNSNMAFLDESRRQTDNALHGRVTGTLRSKAMRLLRSGVAPDQAAAELGVPRSEMRLIARVARILRDTS